jgi:hypothetical protein
MRHRQTELLRVAAQTQQMQRKEKRLTLKRLTGKRSANTECGVPV